MADAEQAKRDRLIECIEYYTVFGLPWHVLPTQELETVLVQIATQGEVRPC